MDEPVTPSHLRQNIYRLLDRVLATGEPLTINRKGSTVLLIPGQVPSERLSAIRTNPSVITGDPEGLVSVDWSAAWDADRELDR
jgi:antitoxin (DNA-binding transcriptional repressor) of toxin-antitoxin stability system